ncbi:hypothetical protein [Atopobium deltae]|uniref:Uncharacterized protein n=1 Tax=Atopobium deltae TaxID=1393034 RepID=A0A133XU11_9ACTN|nr:hypothetical protein [Atopobium deltae]KXB34420.1 hypothetical protein HMPREF3192_00859 [Atopobium deltae]
MESEVHNDEATTPQENSASADKPDEAATKSTTAEDTKKSSETVTVTPDAPSAKPKVTVATSQSSTNPSSANDLIKTLQGFIQRYSKNFLYEKLLMGLYGLAVVLFLFIMMQISKLQNTSSSGSFMQAIGKSLDTTRTITGAFGFFTFVLWVAVAILGLSVYNRCILRNDRSKTFLAPSILGLAGLVVVHSQNLTLSKAMRFLSGFSNLNFGEILGGGAEVSTLSEGSANIMMVLYLIGFALLIAAIVFYFRFIKTTNENTVAQSDEEIAEALKTGKANAQKAMAAGVDLAEKGAQKAKEVMQSQEVQNVVKTGKQTVAKNKKTIVLAIAAVAVVLVGILGFTLIGAMLKPDAVVSMKDMQIVLNIEGKSGYGKATAEVMGEPLVTEIKDPKQTAQIQKAVHEYDIKINKSEKLKNGDEITVTAVVKDSSLNLKFDTKELKKTVTVEGLEEIVNSAKELDTKVRERMTQKAKTDIGESIRSDIKNLKVEKLKTFERPIPEAELEKEYSNQPFTILEAYKVTFDEKKFKLSTSDPEEFEPRERVYVYEFSGFRKKGSAVDFDFGRATWKDSLGKDVMTDLENRYQVEGYTVVE